MPCRKSKRDTPVLTKKVVRHFKEQDEALQKKLAAKGEYRWGSVWVSEKELKKLQDDEKVVKDQLTQMQNDFDSVQKRISQIDGQITDIVNEMNQIDAQTYMQANNGQVFRLPYPTLYYTLSQQLSALKNERASRLTRIWTNSGQSGQAAQHEIAGSKIHWDSENHRCRWNAHSCRCEASAADHPRGDSSRNATCPIME